ncbi:hypothetical protein IJG29_03965 [Candidatus Saccharibacteria bacterium]|nr:hypothetical protein [Candidatus Saccharibacteria bacterium]
MSFACFLFGLVCYSIIPIFLSATAEQGVNDPVLILLESIIIIFFSWFGTTALKGGIASLREGEDAKDEDATPTGENKQSFLSTPESIRDYLREACEGYRRGSEMHDKICHIIKQLNDIKSTRENCRQLFKANDITSLDEVIELLGDIENAICMHGIKRLVNYQLAGTERLFLDNYNHICNKNQTLITEAHRIVEELADFINGGIPQDEITYRIEEFRRQLSSFVKTEDEEMLQPTQSSEMSSENADSAYAN